MVEKCLLALHIKNFIETKERLKFLEEIHDTLQTNSVKWKCDSENLKALTEKYSLLQYKYETIYAKNKDNCDNLLQLEHKNNILTIELETVTNQLINLQIEHSDLSLKYKNLEQELNATKNSLFYSEEINEKYAEENQLLKSNLNKTEARQRYLHNLVQDLKGNIRVYCRIRPPLYSEDTRLQTFIRYLDENTLEIKKTQECVSFGGRPTDSKQEFSFDKVFPPGATQVEIFEELALLIQSALDGYHVCIFAYGQTGSGKTYTMQGSSATSNSVGVIPRSIDLLFKRVEEQSKFGWCFHIQCCFIEIYNENIKDLLNPDSKLPHEIRFNEGKGTTVTNLTIELIKSASELQSFMSIAHSNRAVAATDFNEHSSRSHSVTKIMISGVHSETNTVLTGSLNLVDLAGSESAKSSSNERLAETKAINKSLSILGSVMYALYNKETHIPYRNSKLTYLLQTCLGGNSKTAMFVNISPFEDCYQESINSLRFAAKVKEVKLGFKRNKSINK